MTDKFSEEFPELTPPGWSKYMSFMRDERGRIGLIDGDFVLSAKNVQKHCLSKSRVVKEKIEREDYWHKRINSERVAWEFYVRAAIKKVADRDNPFSWQGELLEELNIEVEE